MLPLTASEDLMVFPTGAGTTILVGEWAEIERVLQQLASQIDYVHLENDRRNSAIPLLDLKHIGARIEPGAVIRDKVEQVVDYMLFIDEAPIPAPITGSSRFASMFSNRGPRDSKGRSLYQLDLETRLMRYPCSYMIYSEEFDRLPVEAKGAIYDRLRIILSGSQRDRKYRQLSPGDRTAIFGILRATKGTTTI